MARLCTGCGRPVYEIGERQKRWLMVAETVDAFRVFPRLFLLISTIMYIWLFKESWEWYVKDVLSYVEVTDWPQLAALTAFPVTLLTALGGIIASIFKRYMDGGRDWATIPTSNGHICEVGHEQE